MEKSVNFEFRDLMEEMYLHILRLCWLILEIVYMI